ncbi:bile acid:sodium symporter family protein [Peribacillus alkalitolerans]|uniref:bile acid:sodium symporter family protein n=1 Tax=Peribacillus alkalitolerans TaxID=1550385 RepID=UPI0013D78D8A|nr:bile acid:sodium symporter [Peribacillus alkalitolerans]
MRLLIHILSTKLWLLIIIVSILTYYSPFYLQVPTWVPRLFLGMVIFLTGLTMNVDSLRSLRYKKKELLIVTVLKWSVTVLISILLAYSFYSTQPDLAAGTILSGTVPSATAATLYTFVAGGNASLVIAASLLDVAISPIITPLAMLGLAQHQVAISFWDLLQSFFLIVIGPLFLGLSIQRMFPQVTETSPIIIRSGSSLSLLLVIHTLVGDGKDQFHEEWLLLGKMILVSFLQILIPMIIAYYLSRFFTLSDGDTKAVMFQVSLCNTALAAILAFDMIGGAGAIPPTINLIINLSLGALISNAMAKRYKLANLENTDS